MILVGENMHEYGEVLQWGSVDASTSSLTMSAGRAESLRGRSQGTQSLTSLWAVLGLDTACPGPGIVQRLHPSTAEVRSVPCAPALRTDRKLST